MKLKNNDPVIFDMQSYRLPGTSRSNVTSLYPTLPRKRGKVNFDIYDYEMLFRDKATNDLIREGRTIGCFYIESPGMRSLLRRLSVDNFEMLTAASSVIRPGVAESGMMQEFIARHKDPKRRKYLVPEMEKYLGETYGVMIYQEDVIKIAHHIAGLSLEEADLLRRAMSGKMRSHEAMKRLTDKFFESCRHNNLSEGKAKELWRQIESFAGYSFCKAHSASFALLSYQVAYLKVYYPAQFMACVLSNQGGFYSHAVYIQECKRMGLSVELPCINKSSYEYTGRDKQVRIGLMAIRNLSRSTSEFIIQERKDNGRYSSLADFLIRTKTGYEESAMLIRCGAMDCFKQTRPTLMRLLDIYVKHRKLLNESYNDLFMNETFKLEQEVITDQQFSIEEICTAEYEAFSYMVTRHPLDFFSEWTSNPSVIPAAGMNKFHGKKIKMIGWYMTSKRIKTRKGDIMKFISLEDLSGTFEAVIFPRTYEQYAEKTLSMGPYLLEGRVDADNGNNLIVEKLELLTSTGIKAAEQKDSAENKYFGDVDKISEEDFYMIDSLDKEKLKMAYL